MSRTSYRDEEHIEASGSSTFGAIFLSDRLDVLRRVTSVALLCGIALSINLWFPISRSLPRAPLLVALPQKLIAPIEYFLSTLLSAALVALLLAKRPTKYLIVAIVAVYLWPGLAGGMVIAPLDTLTRESPWRIPGSTSTTSTTSSG